MDEVTRKYIDAAEMAGFNHGVLSALVAMQDAIEPMRQLDKRIMRDPIKSRIAEATEAQ